MYYQDALLEIVLSPVVDVDVEAASILRPNEFVNLIETPMKLESLLGCDVICLTVERKLVSIEAYDKIASNIGTYLRGGLV